jgi:hypothetical protein
VTTTNRAAAPDPDRPHIVGRTTRVPGTGMHETSCSCGTVVHDVSSDASAAALSEHRAVGAERVKRSADVPSFNGGSQ